MRSGEREVDVGEGQCSTINSCAINHRVSFSLMKSSTVDLWTSGVWAIVGTLDAEVYLFECPPYVHLVSTRCHSRDRCSQTFPAFHRSSTSVHYTERKQKNKEQGMMLWYPNKQVLVASFPGSSTLEHEIELVHAERAWYFFSHEHHEGRMKVERPQLCMGIPETQNRNKSEGSGQLTTCI